MELAHSYIEPSTRFDNTKTQPAFKFTPTLSNIYETAFFEFPAWTKHISYFKNNFLCQKNVGMLIGANGSGKTTLLQRLASEIPSHFFTHRLIGDAKLKLEDLVADLQASLDVPCSNDIVTLEQVDQIVYQLLTRQDYFLLVDDAHKIPLETLEGLLRIGNNAKEFPRLQIFLSGDLYLKKRIEGLQQKLGRNIEFPVIELSALTFDETRDYVEFWSLKMNAERETFSELMLQRIYSLSGGFPGRINRVAQQIMRDRDKFEQQFSTKEETQNEADKRSQLSYRLSLTFSLLLLLASIVYYFYQDRVIPLQKTRVLAQQENINHDSTSTQIMKPSASQDGFAYIASIEGLPIEHLQPQPSSIKKTLQQIDQHPAQQSLAKTEAVQQKPLTIHNKVEDQSKAIIASSAKLPFTIQLMAGRHRPALNQFRNLPRIKSKSQIIHTSLYGRDWFVLVYGNFANREQARLELNQLSSVFKTQKPWIRSIASLSNK